MSIYLNEYNKQYFLEFSYNKWIAQRIINKLVMEIKKILTLFFGLFNF